MIPPIRTRLSVNETIRLRRAITDNIIPKKYLQKEKWFMKRIKMASIPAEIENAALVYCFNNYRKYNEYEKLNTKYLEARKRTPPGICVARATPGNMFRKSIKNLYWNLVPN